MSEAAALFVVRALETYLAFGLLFAVPFVTRWVGRTDSRAHEGTWGFRILIVPGVTLLWPLLARRLFDGRPDPPDGWTAHRADARSAREERRSA
jgi:hypothetical protein